MERFADLHIHTYYSDSTSSPEEVVEQAHAAQLHCIGIADHDTVDGIMPTVQAAEKYGIEVIPAIELSSEHNGKDIHILGYLFDHKDPSVLRKLNKMQDVREQRAHEMIDKLSVLGVDGIEFGEVSALTKSKAIGRPHMAAVLVQKGVVRDIKEAFDKYLAEGKPAYVGKFKQTPEEAILLIRDAGGIAVLAHPMFTRVDELIAGFVKAGLGGLEVYYPNVSSTVVNFYAKLARKYDLAVTGGSDAHGDAKQHTYVGRIKVPYEIVENLRHKRAQG